MFILLHIVQRNGFQTASCFYNVQLQMFYADTGIKDWRETVSLAIQSEQFI